LSVVHFLIAAVMIYGICFGLGHLLFRHYVHATVLLAVAVISALTIALTWRYRAYERPDEVEVGDTIPS
jgi:membrane protein YdbS with pleckstrin-like domain